MTSNEWLTARTNNIFREFRMEDKVRENQTKPPLHSLDVLQTKDYVFSPMPYGRIGNSGRLLLAKKKSDRSQRYMIKHADAKSAANEFVYTKLAQAMGLKMPDAVLYQLSDGEKRRYFRTEYILGTRFLDIRIEEPSYQQIREQAINWKDYYRFRTMFSMFCEKFSVKVPLASDGYIYRVDTTNSFGLSTFIFEVAELNMFEGGVNYKEDSKRYIEEYDYDNCWARKGFCSDFRLWVKEHGEECRKYYLEPLAWIQEIPNSYIEDILNTLCYIYPDFIGDYYKHFISALQRRSAIFLNEKR